MLPEEQLESAPEAEPVQESQEELPQLAQSFSQSQNGLVVDVYAPEGAFPADTQMYLTDVSEESIRNLVSNEDHGQILSARAVSVSFYQGDAAVSPDQEIRITIYAQEFEGQEGHTVFYAVNDSIPVQEIRAEGNRASFSTADLTAPLQTLAAVSFQETIEEQEYTEEPSYEEPAYEEPSPEIYFMEEESEDTDVTSEEEITEETEKASPEIYFMEEETTEEVTTEEETTEEETTEEEIRMPEAEFTETASNGVLVHVSAEKGTFPEGTSMQVSAVDAESVMGAVEAAVEGEILEVLAVDIVFLDPEGVEIQPLKAISVILTMPQESSVSEAASNADVAVSDVNQDLIHLDDAGTAQIVENVDISADGTDVAFSSADFSIYAAILSTESGPTEMDGQSYQISHAGWYMTVKSGNVGRTGIPAAASWWTFSTAPGGYRLSSDGRYLRLNGSQWALTNDASAAAVFDVSFSNPCWLIQEKQTGAYVGYSNQFKNAAYSVDDAQLVLSNEAEDVTVSGSYVLVVTDQYGAQGALMAETSKKESKRLAVAAYDPAALHTVWTFEKAAGASLHYVYTYVDGVPKYLNLGNGTLSLSDSPLTVYISSWNGAIRMVNTDGYAVNLGGNSVVGGKGFGAYYNGDVAPNEWISLIPDSGLKIQYVYAAGEEADGTAEELPAGKSVILHNYEYSLEGPEIESYLSKDKTIGYVYSFAGWKAKDGTLYQVGDSVSSLLTGEPAGSTVTFTSAWTLESETELPVTVQYNVARDAYRFGSLEGTMPEPAGEKTADIPHDEAGSYTVLGLTDDHYKEYDGKRYFNTFEFIGWEMENGDTVQPGDVIDLRETDEEGNLILDADQDGIVTFKTLWNSGWKDGTGLSWVNFMVWTNISSADNVVNNGGRLSEDTVNYATVGSWSSTYMQALDENGNVIRSGQLSSPARNGKKFELITYANSSYPAADSAVRELLAAGGYGAQDPYNGYVNWYLPALPSDEEVLASLRNSSMTFKDEKGNVIPKEELTTDNYFVQWISVKYQSGAKDGWHIDGKLVHHVCYTVQWLNEDGTVLEEDTDVEYGYMPVYNGEVPVKTDENGKSYAFSGWDKELEPVTEDVVYTARFVEAQAVSAEIKGSEKTVTYNGQDQETADFDITFYINGVETDMLPEHVTFALDEGQETAAKGTDAGEYTKHFSGTLRSENPFYVVYEPVISGTNKLTITKRNVTLTSASDEKEYDGSALINGEVTVGGDGFVEGEGAQYKVTGSRTIVGSSDNIFTYTLNEGTKAANYTITTAHGTLKVTDRKVPFEITVTAKSGEVTYDGTEQSISGLKESSFEVNGSTYTVSGLSASVSGTDAGEYTAWITGTAKVTDATENDVTAQFAIKQVSGTLTIKPAQAVVTAKAASKEYGLEDPVFEAEVTGLAAGDEGKIEYTVQRTNEDEIPGQYSAVITAAGAESQGNYTVSYEPADFEIKKVSKQITVTIAENSDSRAYNGTEQTLEGYTVSSIDDKRYTADDFTFTGKASVSAADAGYYEMQLSPEDFSNTNEYFENVVFVIEDGGLTILPYAETVTVTITGHSDSVVYNGQGQSVSGYDVTADNSLYAASDLAFSGTDIVSGVNAGTYEMTLQAQDFANTNANFSNVTFAVSNGKLEITRREVVLTSASGEKEYDGDPLTADTVNVTGDGFVEGEGASFEVTGSRTLVGESDNIFNYTLNEGTEADNYAITTEFGTLQVTSRDVRYEINVRALSSKVLYNGTEQSVSGFEASEFTIEGNTYTVEGLTAGAKGTDAGIYPARIEGTAVVRDSEGNDVTSQFIVNLTDGSLEIVRRQVTLTSGTSSREYDGSALTNDTVEVTGDGFAEGEGVSFTVTGQQLTAGFSENTFEWTADQGTNVDNYDIAVQYGILTVTNRQTRYEIEVTAKSGTAQYDAAAHSVEGLESTRFGIGKNYYTVEGLSASASGLHAGTYTVPVTGTPVVRDKSGNDVTDQFTVKAVPGTLTIEPRAVRLISDDAQQVYDGHSLKNDTVSITGDGFVEGEGADFTVTGSRTLPGASDNTFRYVLKEGVVAGDYDITTAYGTLTVLGKPEDARFEITASGLSDTVLYDGQSHMVSGIRLLGDVQDQQTEEETGNITFTIDGVSFTLAGLTSSVSEVDAGTYRTNVEGTPYVYDAEGNDVSDQFLIHTLSGELSIGKRQVTMTSGSAAATYTGKLLTEESVEVTGDGFVEGEGASYLFSGSRSIVGVSENTFDYELAQGTDADNYDISLVFGTLTVTNRDARYLVTVTARSAEYLYDGTEHSVSGLGSNNVTIDGVTYIIQGLTASASAADAGEYQVSVTGIAQIVDPEGHDVTDQFAVETRSGTLRIRPRSVVFTSANASKEFDGTALHSDEITVGGDGFADGEGASFMSTAQRILVGTTENTFTWTLQDNTKEENYLISTEYGALNVLNRDALYNIVLTVNSDSVPYDGQEHEVSGFEQTEFEIDGNTYHVEGLSAYASGTQAGIYSTGISGTAKVLDAAGNDVTGQFAVEVVNGSLTIRDTYLLTIRFVDEDSSDLQQPVTLRFEQGEAFGPFEVPVIDGLVPAFDAIVSPADGMPAQDLEITVVYRSPAPATPAGNEEETTAGQEETTAEQGETTTEEVTTATEEPTTEVVTTAPAEPAAGQTETTAEVITTAQEEPTAEIITTVQGEPAAEIITTVQGEPAAEIITTVPEETTTEVVTTAQEVPSVPGPVEPQVIADEPETYRLGVIEVDGNGDADLVEIDDYKVPLAAPSAGYWALLNFLLALCTVFGMILIAVICILGRKEKNHEDDAEKKSKGIRKWLVYLSPIPAIAAVIIFLLTEDLTKSMAMTDKWTILMAVIFLIELALLIFSRKKKQDEEEEY